ncbi:unnamed protein product [Didymodactylos carnosus]|uniref:Uncharacterized protein n=1 Tax=Didymodactylos carnosus TaxID=1234261 RepID=A0A8S2EGY9_9BILA|nr:unnamed protein product [Didymodactylos carnosus]CAF4031722.1 unnamed protein product [Didymodactylos carnosus]
MGVRKKLKEKIFGPNANESPTDFAEPLLHVTETGNDGDESAIFLDKVYASLNEFNEQHRRLDKNKSYETDIRMMGGYAVDNIENKRFVVCLDVYFYLYRKIDEYASSNRITTLLNDSDKFKKTLLVHVYQTFTSSGGLTPNLTTKNADIIPEIIARLITGPGHNIIVNYLSFSSAFEEFSFDIPTFIHLMTLSGRSSSLSNIFHYAEKLGYLSKTEFYEQYLELFARDAHKTKDTSNDKFNDLMKSALNKLPTFYEQCRAKFIPILETIFYSYVEMLPKYLVPEDGTSLTFQPIIAWLKIYEVANMDFLLISLKEIEENDMELVFVKNLVKSLLVKLIPLSSHLQRLCRLLSCSTSFTITNQDAINLNRNAQEFIKKIKQSSSANTFDVGEKSIGEKLIKISGRQLIQWSLACENHPCDIQILHTSSTAINNYHRNILFRQQDVPINSYILKGEYETQRGGNFIFLVDNHSGYIPRKL